MRELKVVQFPTLRHLISSAARLVASLISSKSMSAYRSGLAIIPCSLHTHTSETDQSLSDQMSRGRAVRIMQGREERRGEERGGQTIPAVKLLHGDFLNLNQGLHSQHS